MEIEQRYEWAREHLKGMTDSEKIEMLLLIMGWMKHAKDEEFMHAFESFAKQ